VSITRIWTFLSSRVTVTFYCQASRLSKSGIDRYFKVWRILRACQGQKRIMGFDMCLWQLYRSKNNDCLLRALCNWYWRRWWRLRRQSTWLPWRHNSVFLCVCLSPSLLSSAPSGFVSWVLSDCGDDRRIGVRLPVRLGGFSLCLCVETHRPWVGLRQEAISPGVSERGVQLSTRFLLLSKDQKDWNHPYACLCVIPARHKRYLAIFLLPWRISPYWANASPLSRIHHTQTNHSLWDFSGRVIRPTQRDSTWQHKTLRRDISIPPTGFAPTFSASEGPQTRALDRAATGIGG
jgi:hypothetical protein